MQKLENVANLTHQNLLATDSTTNLPGYEYPAIEPFGSSSPPLLTLLPCNTKLCIVLMGKLTTVPILLSIYGSITECLTCITECPRSITGCPRLRSTGARNWRGEGPKLIKYVHARKISCPLWCIKGYAKLGGGKLGVDHGCTQEVLGKDVFPPHGVRKKKLIVLITQIVFMLL